MVYLSIKLLGSPESSVGSDRLHFRTKKTYALLYYLAAEGGMHRREKLAELLWPGSVDGRTPLRSALANLRRTLDAAEEGLAEKGLVVERDRIGLGIGSGLVLDLQVVRDALGFDRTSSAEELERLRVGAAAYRGEFLKDFYMEDVPEFDLWVAGEREVWRLHAGEVFGRLSQLGTDSGDPVSADREAEAWVMHDPTSEAATIRHMQTRQDLGDLVGATLAFEKYRTVLNNRSVEPGTEASAKAEAIRSTLSSHWSRTPAKKGREKEAPSVDHLWIPLVGRAEEFSALVEEYSAATSGELRILAVLGEGGMGKTRLVEEFLRWAAVQGAEVLRGQAWEGNTGHSLIVEALRERMERERAPDDLLADVWLTELSRVLPELRERYPDLPSSTQDPALSSRLFESIARFGSALAERGTMVLVADDLQWADASTLEVLQYACAYWIRRETPVLLVLCASIDVYSGSDLKERLSTLEREYPVRKLSIGPIGEEDTLELVRRLVGENQQEQLSPELERLGRWLYAETGGQPLFITQTIKSLVEEGTLSTTFQEGGKASILLREEMVDESNLEGRLRGFESTGVRGLIRYRLSRLSSVASSLAAAGAVLGGDFSFDSLLKVAMIEEQEIPSAVDELLSARVLLYSETKSHGVIFSFSHERVRQVAYTEAGVARRYMYHRRALALLQDSLSAAELACHALAAGETEAAFSYLIDAGDNAMDLFAATDAVGHYERARELLREQMEEGLPVTRSVGGRDQRVSFPAEEVEHLYVNLGRARELVDE